MKGVFSAVIKRTQRTINILADEKKAQKILKDKNFDRFDDVATVEFWSRLARILADELKKATNEKASKG